MADLKLKKFIHPKVKNRIVVDYPLDVLLNRECLLRDYERGAISALQKYETCVIEAILIKSPDLKILEDIITKTAEEFQQKKCTELISKYGKTDSKLLRAFFSVFRAEGSIGGIRLPIIRAQDWFVDDPGTGNILIKGRPGTGKSTLALQLAVAGTYSPNRYSAIYLSLEESVEYVLKKAQKMGWSDKVLPFRMLDNVDESSSYEDIGREMVKVMTQPDNCKFKINVKESNDCKNHQELLSRHSSADTEKIVYFEPRVIAPILSPRPLSKTELSSDTLFWERYRQLEKLLIGAKWLRDNDNPSLDIPEIGIICIDSLNVFGNDQLTRAELFQIFDLIKRYGFIGVFTSEQDLGSENKQAGGIADYLSDVLIQLYQDEEAGYSMRFFEICKSRYQHEVYGKHFVRMRGQEVWDKDRRQWQNVEEISKTIAESVNNSNFMDLENNIDSDLKNLLMKNDTDREKIN